MKTRGTISIWLALVATGALATTVAMRSPGSHPGERALDPAPAPLSTVADSPPAPDEVAPDHVEQITLAYMINNFGYIDVCGCKNKKIRQGSLTRRMSLLRQLRSLNPSIMLIDGGNTFFNREDRNAKEHERLQLIERAKVIVESFNRMGYHATTMGHVDLSLGLDVLKDLLSRAKFKCVCANFVNEETGELVFDPYIEIEVGGVKAGILGLTINTLQPHYIGQKAPGTKVIDGLEAAKKYVPMLRERNDIVVVMSQNSLEFNEKLAAEVKGIDFVLDPHFKLGSTKIWVEEEDLVQAVGDSFIVRSDAQGARLQTLNLWMQDKGRPFLDRKTVDKTTLAKGTENGHRSSFTHKRYPIEPHFLEDPDIAALVDAFRSGTQFVNTELLPELVNKDKYLTQETCGVCHEDQHKFWQGTKHATAFASLEETGDQWRQDCIGCHVLGYGQTFYKPADAEPYKNVQCESCHGLNPNHPEDPAAHKWPRIVEKTCLTCHNKAQTLADFKYGESKRKMRCPPMER